MPRLLLTGSSGLIGRALSSTLAEEGWEIVRLRRQGADGPSWDPPAGRIDRLPPCEAVVHLAGAGIAERRWTARRKAELVESRVAATRLLIGALAAMPVPPRVLVSASAVGYYGDTGDHPRQVGDPAGEGFLARLCQDWEDAAAGARALGLRVISLRFGLVLSAGGGALARMLPAFRLGLGGPLGDGRQWWSWIAREDAVRAIRCALLDPSWEGAFDVVAPEPLRQRDFAQALGRVLRRPSLLPLPRLAVGLLLGELGRSLLLGSSRVPGTRLAEAGFVWDQPALEACLRFQLRQSS